MVSDSVDNEGCGNRQRWVPAGCWAGGSGGSYSSAVVNTKHVTLTHVGHCNEGTSNYPSVLTSQACELSWVPFLIGEMSRVTKYVTIGKYMID